MRVNLHNLEGKVEVETHDQYQNKINHAFMSKGVTPIRGFKPTTASLGLESPRGNTESFYKATTYE